jgi:hypothetical protein
MTIDINRLAYEVRSDNNNKETNKYCNIESQGCVIMFEGDRNTYQKKRLDSGFFFDATTRDL